MTLQDWAPSKLELGAGYLAGAGLALLASLGGYLWFSRDSLLAVSVILTMAVVLFSTMVYIGYVFYDVGLDDGLVWTVARWVAVGLGLSVVFATSVAYLWGTLRTSAIVPGLLIVSIGTWVVLCTLLGVLTGLRSNHQELQAVSQRNSVMNRVLRHNIRNEMNVIHGHAQLLADDSDHPPERSIEAIQQAVQGVLRLSDAARQVDGLGDSDDGPVDVAAMARECATDARRRYQAAEVAVDAPETVLVDAGPILRSVLDNLVENAVDHHDGERPVRVTISVSTDDSGQGTITVADNGPGIPTREREVLFSDREEPTTHSLGLGLWLVRWIVDRFDGELTFEENRPRGTIVTVRLPAVEQPTTGLGD